MTGTRQDPCPDPIRKMKWHEGGMEERKERGQKERENERRKGKREEKRKITNKREG